MAPATLVRSNPATKASYSTSLLVIRNYRQTMHSISSLSGEWSTIPAPSACLLDDSFMWILHGGYSSAPWPSILVNFAMKSTTTYPFILVHGQYCTSNSLNSIAHSVIHPMASGLLIALYKGLSVKTIIVWSFIEGYLSSTSQSAITSFYTLSSSLTKAILTIARETAR